MSVLDGKAGSLALFDNDGKVNGFAVFNDFPVSSARQPDAVYTKTENGWVSDSGSALNEEDAAELEALANPVQLVPVEPVATPDAPVSTDLPEPDVQAAPESADNSDAQPVK